MKEYISLSLLLLCFLTAIQVEGQNKIIRFSYQENVYYGLLEEATIKLIEGNIFDEESYEVTDIEASLSDVKLLPPVNPSKIIAYGLTFRAHAEEVGENPDIEHPLLFMKPPSSLIAHNDTIVYPDHLSNEVEQEAELAIIIGKKGRFIGEEDALDYVLGYSCFNDVSARDLIRKHPQIIRGKGFDTFGPMGPWIVAGIEDPTDLRIISRINGEVKQDSKTSMMRFSIPYLISHVSEIMTLEPGDVILTGTPGGSVPMKPGDVVEVEIEHIGTLKNYVK